MHCPAKKKYGIYLLKTLNILAFYFVKTTKLNVIYLDFKELSAHLFANWLKLCQIVCEQRCSCFGSVYQAYLVPDFV